MVTYSTDNLYVFFRHKPKYEIKIDDKLSIVSEPDYSMVYLSDLSNLDTTMYVVHTGLEVHVN